MEKRFSKKERYILTSKDKQTLYFIIGMAVAAIVYGIVTCMFFLVLHAI